MAEVITRFKLETTQYDSKLRDAAKGLQEFTRVVENGGKGFTDFSQKAIEAARSLGQTASGATNLKDKVKDLVGAYNDAAKAYNKLSQEQQQSDFGKALAQSIGQLSDRIKDAKQELYGLGDAVNQVKEKSGGLFGEGGLTGMLSVAGGNILAQGISKFTSEMADAVRQSVELSKEGEGIRIAFERLNRPGLLDNLKEATHGTVSEIELMKQAIKFENFKLPLEDLSTYLAFAQQKAKDTGESIDYLVNSIVTGLGRQSKQILDNLGISASELTRRMNEGADMTKAVADIIREEMTKAGDYVETAADRAARAAAEATNEMERLGREAQPFAEEWAKAWNEIQIGGMQLLTTVLGPLARSAREIRQILSGDGFKVKAGIPNLAEGVQSPWANWKPGTDHTVQVPGGYVEVTDANTGAVIGGKHFDNLADTNAITAWEKSLFKSTGSRSGKSKAQTEAEKQQKFLDSIANHLSAAQTKTNMLVEQEFAAGGVRRQMPSVYEMMLPEIKKQILDKKDFDLKKLLKEYVADPDASKRKQKDINEADKFASDLSKITGSVSSIASGLQALGVEIPEGLSKTIAVMQTVSGILTAILAITTAIQATSSVSATANVIDAVVPLVAKGGIVPKAATGYYVPGKRFSGDTTHIMANAGELVLNKSSQGNLAAMIRNAESLVGMIDRYQNSFLGRTQYGNEGVNFSGGAMSNLNLSATLTGEQIRLVLNNNGRRTGRGEYITTNFKRS